jgi:hypothetical protein
MPFVISLTEAAIAPTEDGHSLSADAELVLLLGIDLLSRIIVIMEKAPGEDAVNVRQCLSTYAAGFAHRFHAAEYAKAWDARRRLDGDQRLLLLEFPVLRAGPLPYVIPVFFWNPHSHRSSMRHSSRR